MYHKNNKFYVAYRLQFFAKEGAGGEKTEEATTKKLEDARKEGQVARSQELITAAGLLTLFLVVKNFAGYIAGGFLDAFSEVYKEIETLSKEVMTYQIGSRLLNQIGINTLIICLPVFIAGFVVAFVVNIFQVKWKITGKPLQPKFNKINPMSGFKKMLSMDKIMELVKSIIKVGIIIYIVYDALKDQLGKLYQLYEIGNLETVIVYIGEIVLDLGINISVMFLIVGFADFIYQKIKFKKDMRMSKQEIKDEFKQSEGDPQIKSKIKQKMRQASQKRMMQRLPEADVVITNPTHFACALKYDKEVSEAPILIAKGADLLAAKIKEIAKENTIPIVENKPLARMLYYNVDIESEIPQELYQMVAEVLAYVYSLKT